MKSVKDKIYLFIIWILIFPLNNEVNAKVEIVLGDVPLESNQNLALSIPVIEENEIIISRPQYVISYNKLHRSANWVAWKLEANQIGNSGRSNNFLQDSDLENYFIQTSPTDHAVNQTEFRGSCYDRGHQIPSADRTDDSKNNQMTFLMSNMTPQTPYLNRVIWAHLEQYTRNLVQKQGKKAYVISGPIYDQDFGSIGPNRDIPIPSKNFKVIFVLDANQNPQDINKETPIISVIMPNTLEDGTNPINEQNKECKPLSSKKLDINDWEKFKAPLEQIEKLSGFKIIPSTLKL